jgi:hypothetical protein
MPMSDAHYERTLKNVFKGGDGGSLEDTTLNSTAECEHLRTRVATLQDLNRGLQATNAKLLAMLEKRGA